jgi:hypothetical protein
LLISKYADHLPLYRQAQIYARQGVNLDRCRTHFEEPADRGPTQIPYLPPESHGANKKSVRNLRLRVSSKHRRIGRITNLAASGGGGILQDDF